MRIIENDFNQQTRAKNSQNNPRNSENNPIGRMNNKFRWISFVNCHRENVTTQESLQLPFVTPTSIFSKCKRNSKCKKTKLGENETNGHES
jgi:hypothetical protein